MQFNDDIRTMYKPSKEMLNAEKLYQTVTGKNSNTSFIIVNGGDLQTILEKEEQIGEKLSDNNIAYYSLSRFVPSARRQKENQQLVKELYDKKLSVFSEFLTQTDIKNLKMFNQSVIPQDVFQNINQLKEFVIDKNNSRNSVF